MNHLYWSGTMFLLCFFFSSVWSEECKCLGLQNDQSTNRGENCNSGYCYVNKAPCRKEGFEVIESKSDATAITQVKGTVGLSRTFCAPEDEKQHLTKFCRCLEKKNEYKDPQNQGENCTSSKFCYVNRVACLPYNIDVNESTSTMTYESKDVGDTNVIGFSYNICGNKKDSKDKFQMQRRCECNPYDEDSCIVQNKKDCEREGITQFEGDRSVEMQKIRKERKRLNQCQCLGKSSCYDEHEKGAVPYCIVNKEICTAEKFKVTPFMEHVFESDSVFLSTDKNLGVDLSQLGLSQDFCKIEPNRYAKNEVQLEHIQWFHMGTIPKGRETSDMIEQIISDSKTDMAENQVNREIADADSNSTTNNWKIGLEAEGSAKCFVGEFKVKATGEYGGQSTKNTDHRELMNKMNKTMNTRIRTHQVKMQRTQKVNVDNNNNRSIYILQISGRDSNGDLVTKELPNTDYIINENETPSEHYALKILGLHHHLDIVNEHGEVIQENDVFLQKEKNNSERKNCCDNCIIV